MPYIDSDLRREVLLACNKALTSMSADEISQALTDISKEISKIEPGPLLAHAVEDHDAKLAGNAQVEKGKAA